MPSRIEDYAMIGDCETAALVGKDGSIDWLCWPRFDSGACFAALLGTPEHGRWQLAPASAPAKVTRRYREDTLILETEFENEQGSVTIVDFMPLREKHSHLVRLVRGKSGRVAMRMELILRFDYGELVPWVSRLDGGVLRAVAGPNMAILRTTVPLRGEDLKTVSEFTVGEGETVPFVLSYAASHLKVPAATDPEKALEQTDAFWKKWTGRCLYKGPYAEAVKRSLITLKGLTYWPTGGIAAAPTTSLPEKVGGTRNWDYRFCWLRDATLTLQTLTRSGYFDEASKWRDWLVRAVAGSPDLVQIMYGLAGERHLKEWELDGLPGYEGSKPVRIGNAAAKQLQLDIYGEITGVLHHARKRKISGDDPDMTLEWALLEHLEKIWRQPDAGMWEVRGAPQQFTFSKMMVWVAFDSAIKSCEQFGLKGPLDRWRAVRQEVHEDVCRNGFCSDLGSFVQSYGSKNLDASLLMIPRVGFLPASDPRVKGTIEAVERGLLREGFVQRYHTRKTEDGLPHGEGVFLACSFWLADAYVLVGRRSDAQRLFEKLLGLRNDLGLLSEEYDPDDKRLVGNFPQAFSHLALVNTAFALGPHP
ncbi:MAG TPA: glycoside hydrolase family 15 protein [Candidatus Acidoferrales bacterium]|nr:glycoside hydrolase family 15 protein [Candidatus Acidoferrales bacterium]